MGLLFGKRMIHERVEQKLIHSYQNKDQFYTHIPYIEIPALHLSKVIQPSTDLKVLDQYYVGIWSPEKDIQKARHLVLAGHNVKNVFASLRKLEIGDLIYIYNKDQKYTYIVHDKKEIHITDMFYLRESEEKKLSLLTCTKNNQKRLLVMATYQG